MKKIVMSLTAIMALGTALNAGTYGNTYDAYDGSYTNDRDPATTIQPVIDVPEIVYDKEESVSSFWTNEGSGFYLGGAYSYINTSDDFLVSNGTDTVSGKTDDSNSGFLVNAGYDFNKYVGIEMRYTYLPGLTKHYMARDYATGELIAGSSGYDIDIANLAGYLKLAYPVTESFSIYGLIGYGSTSWTADEGTFKVWDSDSSMQYGGGLKYGISESFSIFADYTLLYDGDTQYSDSGEDWSVDSTISSINIGVTYKF